YCGSILTTAAMACVNDLHFVSFSRYGTYSFRGAHHSRHTLCALSWPRATTTSTLLSQNSATPDHADLSGVFVATYALMAFAGVALARKRLALTSSHPQRNGVTPMAWQRAVVDLRWHRPLHGAYPPYSATSFRGLIVRWNFILFCNLSF